MVRHRAGQAGIAQSVEHFTRNEGVVGSSPISGLKMENDAETFNQSFSVFLLKISTPTLPRHEKAAHTAPLPAAPVILLLKKQRQCGRIDTFILYV